MNQDQFGGLAGNIHHNIPMSSNAVLQQENWLDENGNPSPPVEGSNSSNHYKVGGGKMKLGAATSTNFMKGQSSQQQQYNMSMLRSVQQNMPNMPNVSNQLKPIFSVEQLPK